MKVTVEKVTPEKAADWLNRNTGNRKMRTGVAEKYAEDMRSGRWTECTAPIAFYDNGDLADGQHRLFGIVESEMSIEFIIVRGLPRDAGLNIDVGVIRSLVDNARISGTDSDLSNEMIAIARAVDQGTAAQSQKNLSNAARLAMVDAHREAARWVIAHGPRGRGVRNVAVTAALGRAWYYMKTEEDLDRLRRFCEVLTTGFGDGDRDSAAVALRNYLQTGGTAVHVAANWKATFLKVQNAISYFMEGRSLRVIKAVSEEQYPLRGKGKGRRA